MTLLHEVLKKVRRLDDLDKDDTPRPEDNEPIDNGDTPETNKDELELGDDDLDLGGDENIDELDTSEDDDLDLDLDDEPDEDVEHNDLNDITNKATEDPNKQGVIRTVKKAHLVYKREQEDGTYEELWIYNVDNMKNEIEIRKAILAGTDIPTNNTSSPDGRQEYTLWACGNAQMLCVKGLDQ